MLAYRYISYKKRVKIESRGSSIKTREYSFLD